MSQGQIELGSVGAGIVNLGLTNQGWTFGYEGVQSFRDISLTQQSAIDASGASGGSIQLTGRQVTFKGGSIAVIQNQGFQPAGSISVNASDLKIIGTTSDGRFASALISETVGGQGGDITILTNHLTLPGSGAIATKTFSNANSGKITVNATDIDLNGSFDTTGRNPTGITATAYNSGRGGDIIIKTRRLNLRNGGIISSSTFGSGTGGDLTVDANDFVKVSGLNPSTSQHSVLTAGTLNSGNAGSLLINTAKLIVSDGGIVSTSGLATGNAGKVTINASDSVEISNTLPGANATAVESAVSNLDPFLKELLRLPPMASGSAGDVTINTHNLSVTNGGLVSVRNQGTGKAGIAKVNASSIFLDNQGSITATSKSGEGGNIILQANYLQIRHHSAIAATAESQGDGGNLNIHTLLLVALENSNLNANANQDRGGNIQITTQGLFLSPDSSITATSQKGINGVISIQNPNVDTKSVLASLPTQITNPTRQITASCPATSGNHFVITGRGGLPNDPTTTLRGETLWTDLRTPLPPKHQIYPAKIVQLAPIIEATGWVRNQQGEISLIVTPAPKTVAQPWQQIACKDL